MLPAIDEVHVGTGSDAQLSGALVHGVARPGLIGSCSSCRAGSVSPNARRGITPPGISRHGIAISWKLSLS